MKGNKEKKKGLVYFIDTNIFLRVIVKDENEKQLKESKKLLELIRLGYVKASISSLILAEVNWVLASYYNLSKEESISYLEGIMNLKNLSFEEKIDHSRALYLWEKHSVKFVDCLIASHKGFIKGNMAIISFDRDFDKIEGIIRKEPKEVIKGRV